MTAHEHTGNDAETRSSVLRSIANSIEPAFPDAADLLLGIARELAARDAAVRADAVAGVLALADEFDTFTRYETRDIGDAYHADSVDDLFNELRAAVAPHTNTQEASDA